MILCDITQSYSPTSGGIRTYIKEKQCFVQACPEYRHILIVPGERDSKHTDGNCITYTIAARPVPGCEPYRFTFRLDKVSSILMDERPDIIELGSPYVLPFAAYWVRKWFPCSLVGFYHTDFPTAYVETFMNNSKHSYLSGVATRAAKRYARAIYNRFDLTLTSSDLMKKRLQTMGIKTIEKVHLGVDLDLFHPNKRNVQFRHQLGLSDDDLILIYSGRLDGEKRVDLLLEAFNRISDRFPGMMLFVGEGPFRRRIQNASERNGKIRWFPYERDRELLAMYLASSDIYTTAGPHETFGLSILEAQACGLPVIGVTGGALVERVSPSVGLLGPVDSVSALSANMLNLSCNGYLGKGKNARRLVEKHFSWHATFTKLMETYELLQRKQTGKQKARIRFQSNLSNTHVHHSPRRTREYPVFLRDNG